MRRVTRLVLIGVLALVASVALAQEPPKAVIPCFDVLAMRDNAGAPALMVNRCTGQTWFLGKTASGVQWFQIPMLSVEKQK